MRVKIGSVNIKVSTQPHAFNPPTDLFETADGYTIRIEIAGMQEDEFAVQYADQVISVLGKRLPLNPKCAYHRLEIPYGEFSTSILLPEDIDVQRASAEYENGFLTIVIPKIKAVDIPITANESTRND